MLFLKQMTFDHQGETIMKQSVTSERKRKPGKLTAVFLILCVIFCGGLPYLSETRKLAWVPFSIAALISCILLWMIATRIKPESFKSIWLTQFLGSLSDSGFFLICLLFFLVSWILPYLGMYPGTFGYDGPRQYAMISQTVPLTLHHPLLHTLLLNFLIRTGEQIGGSLESGVAFYSFVQGFLCALTFSYLLLWLRKRKAKAGFLLFSLIWLAWNPFIQTIIFTTTKDVLFGCSLLIFSLLCLDVWQKGSEMRAGRLILLSFFGLLVCLLRNQGIYIVGACALFYFIFQLFLKSRGTRRWQISVSLLASCLFCTLFQTGAQVIFDIPKGNSKEMLSVPMQQLAYTARNYQDGDHSVMSEKDYQEITEFIPAEGLDSYMSYCADPVKNSFRTEVFMKDLEENVSLYLRIGLQNPYRFFWAWQQLVSGYFDWTEIRQLNMAFKTSFPDLVPEYPSERSPLCPDYYYFLYHLIQNQELSDNPVMNLLFSPSEAVWMLLLILIAAAGKRNLQVWIVLFPFLVFFASLLLGPIAMLRYLFPLICIEPVLFWSGWKFLRLANGEWSGAAEQ